MELELTRQYYPNGTNGALACNGTLVCATIELPWKNNNARVSCIPEGRYRLVKRYSPHLHHHFHLEDVPGREYILIHPANDALKELQGCIAPVTVITGTGQGSLSVKAMEKLRQYLTPVFDFYEPVFITIKKLL